MNLKKKKELAAKALGIGKGRVWINPERANEIKDAITKQDILDLQKDGVVKIREITGRRKNEKRKTRKRKGNFRKRVKNRKKHYVNKIRKLRKYAKFLLQNKKISKEEYKKLRKNAKAGIFKSKRHLKEQMNLIK